MYIILSPELQWQPASISTTLKQAEEGCVDGYLTLTDSIVRIIKCCPTSLARSTSLECDKAAIKKVWFTGIIAWCSSQIHYSI